MGKKGTEIHKGKKDRIRKIKNRKRNKKLCKKDVFMFEILTIFFIAFLGFTVAEVYHLLFIRNKRPILSATQKIFGRNKYNLEIMRVFGLLICIIGLFFMLFALQQVIASNYIISSYEQSNEKIDTSSSLFYNAITFYNLRSFFELIRLFFSSNITVTLLAVALEVYALLTLIKWEIIRELREKHLDAKEAERLFFKGIKYIIGFFVFILGAFYIVASINFFILNKIGIMPFYLAVGPLSGLWMPDVLKILFLVGFLVVMLSMISAFLDWPKIIMNYSYFPKNTDKITLETIFKNKLIAVLLVILGISAPIFLAAVDKYHLF